MSAPIVFLRSHTIKEGKLHAFKNRNLEMANFMEANNPRRVACLTYLHEDGAKL